ncbi:hypothetical protein ACFX2I_014143 [Malus domestica]
MLEVLSLFSEMGCSNEQLGELIGQHPDILFDGLGELKNKGSSSRRCLICNNKLTSSNLLKTQNANVTCHEAALSNSLDDTDHVSTSKGSGNTSFHSKTS